MRLALAISALWIASATAAFGEPWRDWDRSLSHECPKQHANWLCDTCWPGLTDAFERTLAPGARKNVELVARATGRCTGNTIGYSCEMEQRLLAYERLRLLPVFTAFACQTVKCERVGSCSRFPGPAAPLTSR
jgi:hypothetical protein